MCIFCQIANGDIPCVKIWEDENFLAFLDGFPNTKGMTLVIPKKHYGSDVFAEKEVFVRDIFGATKKVVDILKKGLKVNRVATVMEGMGIDHAHIKLYPMHGIGGERKEYLSGDPVYFDKYQGYITSKMGPQIDREELKKIAKDIRANI